MSDNFEPLEKAAAIILLVRNKLREGVFRWSRGADLVNCTTYKGETDGYYLLLIEFKKDELELHGGTVTCLKGDPMIVKLPEDLAKEAFEIAKSKV